MRQCLVIRRRNGPTAVTHGLGATASEAFERFAVGTAFPGVGIEDRLHTRHPAEQLGDCARGDVTHQPATGALLLGQDGRSRWRELPLETVTEKEPPARSVDDIVAVFAP